MNNIKPLGDRIYVERLPSEEVSKGGIFIPDNAKEKPQQGIVRAVGKGRIRDDGTFEPMDLRVGDKIIFGKYSGSSLESGDDTYLIMRQDDVLGVLED